MKKSYFEYLVHDNFCVCFVLSQSRAIRSHLGLKPVKVPCTRITPTSLVRGEKSDEMSHGSVQ